MSRIKKPTFMIPSASAWVRSALSYPGLAGGAVGRSYVSTPHLSHAIAQWVIGHWRSEKWWLAYNLKMQKQTIRRFEARRKRLAEQESSKEKAA